VSKPMTYRDLILWLERYAQRAEGATLDMPVIVRALDDSTDDLVVASLVSVEVTCGCTETLALVLDASTEVEPVTDVDAAKARYDADCERDAAFWALWRAEVD
jgi:hypothetical protein